MSRVPRIRFKGFEEDWEQRKLGEMYTQLVERNIELLPFKKILSASTMNYKVDGSGAAEESLSNYKRLRVGDIAFEGHTSRDFRYGRFVLNDMGDGILSPRFSALRPIRCMPIKFWKYYIHYEPIMKKILANSTKSGTMMNELVVEEFLKEVLLVPEEYEQQKIGGFFNGLDHLITLHQRKLEKLKIIKKSMLENLFPQNGEKTPKIRFSGFTEDWEQRKLGEVVGIYDGVHQTPKYQDNGIMFLSVENIATLQSTKYISEDDFKRDYKVYPQENDILMTRIGDVGTTNVIADKGLKAYYVSLALLKYKSTNPYFLSNAIQSEYVKKELANRTLKTAIPMKINKDEIGKVDVMLPILVREQTKIGEYFCNLDHLITLHQSKLEKLQKIKKSMLESMFV